MKAAVLDACFPEGSQSRGMAAEYLLWDCRRNGIDIVEPRSADVILVSCVHAQQERYTAAVKKRHPRKTIVVGGFGALSPVAILGSCDAVVLGDGQSFISALRSGTDAALALENVLTRDKKTAAIDHGFPWTMPPIQAEDGAYRLWCGRGCKLRCSFCMNGWSQPYSENPDGAGVCSRANSMMKDGKRIAYLSNDPNQHSFASKLPTVAHGSYSVAYLRRNGLPKARQARLGIEGVSERMRKIAGKPISRDDLVRCSVWLGANGIGVRWFMIAGLPGETDSDWEELKESVQQYKMESRKGVLGISFTAWCPDPATPMARFALDDAYYGRFERFKKWFFGGLGFSNRIKVMAPQAPKTRLEKAQFSMALSSDDLMCGFRDNPNAERVKYPFAAARDKRESALAAEIA